jgi:hypothetical protein
MFGHSGNDRRDIGGNPFTLADRLAARRGASLIRVC